MNDPANSCRSCGSDNPQNANHCIHCGIPISIIPLCCFSCGTVPPSNAKFCPQCGSPLATRSSSLQKNVIDTGQIDSAEYRQVTVLFCDMVKSTLWIQDLGSEAYRLVNLRYREICAPIINKYGGKISRFMGDGFLALFGYPTAHEDDAQRAARAGLEITSEIAIASFPIDGRPEIKIEARVGIATGQVVSSEEHLEGIPKELSVVGETPNLASRIQEQAKPNSVLVNSVTQRLVQSSIQTVSIGHVALKGFPDLIELFELVTIKSPISQESEVRQRTVSPLIGRQYELRVLRDCWKHVQQGHGRIVLIRGDAGIGKSRLLREVRTGWQSQRTWLEFRCSSYSSNSAFYPVIERLKQLCDLSKKDKTEDIRCKLQSFCGPYLSFPEQLIILADLLDAGDASGAVRPAQRGQPLDALVALFTSYAEAKKLVLVIEDVHWIDPSTEILLTRLVDQIAMVPMLVLVTSRPEHQVDWLNKSYALKLTPAHLKPSETEEMIEGLTKSVPIPSNIMAQLAYKTDGVPLYVEELTRAVVESVSHSSVSQSKNNLPTVQPSLDSSNGASTKVIQIPETLRDSFMERLDRLGASKNLVHLASALGRSFSYEQIKVASDLTVDELQKQLETLVESDLLHQKGVPPNTTYFFKHSLIQDAAYESILTSNRRIYHERIANRFSTHFPDVDRANPELVARHFVLARKPGQSVARWSKAAQYALRRGTGREAITHAVEGLRHIESAPKSDRNDLELELCITHAVALSATNGFAMPEVHEAFDKAYELCINSNPSPQRLFPVLQGQQQVSLLGGSLIKAQELGERLVKIASDDEGALDRRAEAHRCLGWTLFCLGNFLSAQEHIKISQSLYDRAKAEEVTQQVIVDAGGVGLANLGWISWFLGDAPESIKNALRSIEHAREIDHPFTLAYTLCTTAAVYQFRREPEAVAKYASETVSIALRHGFKYWSAWGSSLVGWSDYMLNKQQSGLTTLRHGIIDYRETSSNLLAPYIFTLLAECEISSGLVDEALITLNEALAVCSRFEIKFYLAEIFRLVADVHRRKNDIQGAIENCEQALKYAVDQGTLALELRVLVFMLEHSLYRVDSEVLHNRVDDLLEAMAGGVDPQDGFAALAMQKKYRCLS